MIRIKICGPTRVTDAEGGAVDHLGGVKPRQVLEMLALSPGVPLSKERIADQLWEGNPPRSYLGTLESYVCVLRRALGAGQGRSSAVRTTSSGYVLSRDVAVVDVDEACTALAAAAHAPAGQRAAMTEAALDLIDGELLASEPYAAWAEEARTGFAREVVGACVQAAQAALSMGEPQLTVTLARRAVGIDPLAESAWLLLMRALWALGQPVEALHAFAELRAVTVAELGVDPAPQAGELYLEILASTQQSGCERGRQELTTLILLLRQALEALPGVDVPAQDSALSQVAARVLSAA